MPKISRKILDGIKLREVLEFYAEGMEWINLFDVEWGSVETFYRSARHYVPKEYHEQLKHDLELAFAPASDLVRGLEFARMVSSVLPVDHMADAVAETVMAKHSATRVKRKLTKKEVNNEKSGT